MTRGLKLRGGGKKGPTARKCLQPKQGLVFQPPPRQRSASTTNHLHSFPLLFFPSTLFIFPSTVLFSLKYHSAPLILIMAKIKAEPGTISGCRLTGRSEALGASPVSFALPATHCKLQKKKKKKGIYIYDDKACHR